MSRESLILCISSMLYMMILSGIALVFYSRLRIGAAKIRMLRRLSARKAEQRGNGCFMMRLQKTLLAATGKPIPPNLFLGFSIGSFFIILFVCAGSFTFLLSLATAAATASVPFVFLWIRLEAVRKRGSYEGETLIVEFLRQYRICGRNIYDGIEQVIDTQTEIPVTGKLLFRLLLKLRSTGDPARIRSATEEFAFSLGTNWGRMFAHNVCAAAINGTDVSLAVEDILIQLREARAASEERKRMNGEAVRMTCFLVPALYLATVLMSVRYLELPLSHFIENQFATKEGLLFFLLISFLFIANLGLLTLVVRQKYDY